MNANHKNRTSLLTGVAIVLFLAVIIIFQSMYDRSAGIFSKESFRFTVKHRSLIPPEVIPKLAFGFENVLADYYWISAVQDFTGWDYKDDFYLNYFKNITALDPRFSYPYLFAILTAPTEKDGESINKVAAVAELGMQALPDNWEIPFYMGTEYNVFNRDTEKAVHYLSIAAAKPNSPAKVKLAFSSLTAKDLLGKNTSRRLMEVIRDTTESETIKGLAEQGIAIQDFRAMLENAVIAYKAKFKTYPKTIDDLTSNHFLAIPETLAGTLDILINPINGTIKLVPKEK